MIPLIDQNTCVGMNKMCLDWYCKWGIIRPSLIPNVCANIPLLLHPCSSLAPSLSHLFQLSGHSSPGAVRAGYIWNSIKTCSLSNHQPCGQDRRSSVVTQKQHEASSLSQHSSCLFPVFPVFFVDKFFAFFRFFRRSPFFASVDSVFFSFFLLCFRIQKLTFFRL